MLRQHTQVESHVRVKVQFFLKSEGKEHPTGLRWTPEDVQPIADKLGIAKNSEEFWMLYAVMNALYSDNYEIAKKVQSCSERHVLRRPGRRLAG